MSRMAISILSVLTLFVPVVVDAFDVTWGSSWDNVSLQTILDDEFGTGVIDAAMDYEGYLPGDADPAYWEDDAIKGLVVREIAGNRNRNTMLVRRGPDGGSDHRPFQRRRGHRGCSRHR